MKKQNWFLHRKILYYSPILPYINHNILLTICSIKVMILSKEERDINFSFFVCIYIFEGSYRLLELLIKSTTLRTLNFIRYFHFNIKLFHAEPRNIERTKPKSMMICSPHWPKQQGCFLCFLTDFPASDHLARAWSCVIEWCVKPAHHLHYFITLSDPGEEFGQSSKFDS